MRSHLARHFPDCPADDDHLRSMAAAAWHQQGIAVIRVDELGNDFERQAITSIADRIYGKRRYER